MSLQDLPDLNFLDTNSDSIRDSIFVAYESFTGKALLPGEPERLFVLSLVNLIVQQRVLLNLAAKQNSLRYAVGDVLQHLGARVETPIIAAQPATTTVRFTLSAPQLGATLIPAGTRTTPGGGVFFATIDTTSIPAGQLTVDVPSKCTVAGIIGNGFIPGQINTLVDPLAYTASVSNTTESSGGAEQESDDNYRERIRQAPESFSVAGPDGAYMFHALSASKDIIDVLVYSPSAGVVEIRPLMTGGELPSEDVLDAVDAACSARTVRPLTDQVQVLAPDEVAYDINVTYWISKDDEANAATIQTAVAAAVADYQMWQRSKLGRDINPDELRKRMLIAGAKRTSVTSPVYTVLTATQKATENTPITLTFGGIEDA